MASKVKYPRKCDVEGCDFVAPIPQTWGKHRVNVHGMESQYSKDRRRIAAAKNDGPEINGSPKPTELRKAALAERDLVSAVQYSFPKGIKTDDIDELARTLRWIDDTRSILAKR